MSDYPTPGGVFLKALENMPESFRLPFVSTEVMKSKSSGGSTTRKNKVKYSCPSCGANVWGKPDLNVVCGDCKEQYQEAS